MILIFDIGKTNKKAFIFDENYQILWQESIHLPETTDEDGDVCEDITLLSTWVMDIWQTIPSQYPIKTVHFSTYGASLVYLDEVGKPLTPLYNYLKPYPKSLKNQFYEQYGGEERVAITTASPVLGSLNSGMQLYRFKMEQPELFKKMKYCLHLPQYISFLITKRCYTDFTSVGCHTHFWDFTQSHYHAWVKKEKLSSKLPPMRAAKMVTRLNNGISVGIGLHDSSAALIPYLIQFKEPFILLSTGTWNIAMNPFNDNQLTYNELEQDCLCYLTYEGLPVKAARLFAGYEHELQINRFANYFNVDLNYYQTIVYNSKIIIDLIHKPLEIKDLSCFETYEIAYHQLMINLVNQQIEKLGLIMDSKSKIQRIFVDGGFAKNDIFMSLLAKAYPTVALFAAEIAQASALGAACVLHHTWNLKQNHYPKIHLKLY